MRRSALIALLVMVSALAVSSGAGAIAIAPGPGGRVLVTSSATSGLQLNEGTASGVFTPATVIVQGPAVYEVLNAWAPDGTAIVVAYDESVDAARKLIVLRRSPGAAAFGAPATLAQGQFVHVIAAAADRRGDIAILVSVNEASPQLLTAVSGGAFGAPQVLPADTEGVALAVGGQGRLVVAYSDSHGYAVRLGTVGGALGPPQRLHPTGLDAAAAVDDAGVATIAFSRAHPVSGVEGPGPATLVAARALPDRRFAAPAPVGAGAPAMAAGFSTVSIAAAGTTTALAFAPASADPMAAPAVGVSIARGRGGFGAVQRPSALPRDGFGYPMDPVLAVDPAGDVLLAYHYGHEGLLGYHGESVHAAERLAHESRFGAPRLLSTLGHGSPPTVALLSNGAPLVGWPDRRLHLRTAITGRRLDLTAPRATVKPTRDAVARLLAQKEFGARITCSEPCIVETLASLRTKTGRAITTDRAILRRAGSITRMFAFNPRSSAGRPRNGSRVKLTVVAENASGIARMVMSKTTLGARGR